MIEIYDFAKWNELNEANKFKEALMIIALAASSLCAKGQCSRVLQAAMENPNDPKNAKILSAAGVDIDAKVNTENGFGKKYQILSKEDQLLLKQQAEQDKKDAKEELRAWNERFNPSTDYNGEHLDREARKKYVEDFKNFTEKHPEFAKENSKYSAIERYAFMHKEVSFLNTRMKYWLKDKLNTMFNPSKDPNSVISEEAFYTYMESDKIKGFDKFITLYLKGFPGVEYSKFWKGE